MQVNYERAVDAVKKELYSWKHRFLSVFGKITVIKTMCLPKLNHIVSVVPNPNLTYLQQLETEFKKFISDNNPNVVDRKTRQMTKRNGGLGMVNVNNFWKALRLSWFRRYINSKSTWDKLHNFETSPNTFNPISSNFESLNKAKKQCKNKFWK